MKGMDASTGKALSGIEHLKQSLRDLLMTRKGTRVMRRAYGSNLMGLVDRPMNASLKVDFVAATADAIARWEPRVAIERVIVEAAAPGHVELRLIGRCTPDGAPLDLAVSV